MCPREASPRGRPWPKPEDQVRRHLVLPVTVRISRVSTPSPALPDVRPATLSVKWTISSSIPGREARARWWRGVVEKLSHNDMISLAAFLSSLQPWAPPLIRGDLNAVGSLNGPRRAGQCDLERRWLFFESSSHSIFSFEHDFFGKPVPAHRVVARAQGFPDHALAHAFGPSRTREVISRPASHETIFPA